MKSPLKDWKHWVVWIVLSLTVDIILFSLAKLVSLQIPFIFYVYAFASWLLAIAIIDIWFHFLKFQ